MKVSTQDNGDVLVAKPDGDIVSQTCEVLRELVSTSLSKAKTAFILDMTSVGFVDSKGLEVLLWIRDYCRLSVVQFRLAGLNKHCNTILEMTRLKQELVCYNQLSDAVKSLV